MVCASSGACIANMRPHCELLLPCSASRTCNDPALRAAHLLFAVLGVPQLQSWQKSGQCRVSEFRDWFDWAVYLCYHGSVLQICRHAGGKAQKALHNCCSAHVQHGLHSVIIACPPLACTHLPHKLLRSAHMAICIVLSLPLQGHTRSLGNAAQACSILVQTAAGVHCGKVMPQGWNLSEHVFILQKCVRYLLVERAPHGAHALAGEACDMALVGRQLIGSPGVAQEVCNRGNALRQCNPQRTLPTPPGFNGQARRPRQPQELFAADAPVCLRQNRPA